MQPQSFSKRQLAATALMLDEKEKNAALSDKMKSLWFHKCFRSRKSEGENQAYLNNYLIVRLDLCLGRMKEYNVRLVYDIQPSWVLS
jgi:hypothetical protein